MADESEDDERPPQVQQTPRNRETVARNTDGMSILHLYVCIHSSQYNLFYAALQSGSRNLPQMAEESKDDERPLQKPEIVMVRVSLCWHTFQSGCVLFPLQYYNLE